MADETPTRPGERRPSDTASVVSRIAGNPDLYDVRTIGTYARLHSDPPDVGVPLTVALAINLNCQVAEQEFRVIAKFGLKAHKEGSAKKHPFFSVNHHIVAYYRARSEVPATQEELQAFASSNGMVHLWPYFRAFVQQTCGQLAIPPIVIPPFRATHPLQVSFGAEEGEVPRPSGGRLPTTPAES